ncbi:hypothetical protein RHMOL_Rhmol05G0111300 [Rhododendron molle]|uniref:Uncharacterized protein n=1 Tax=Rhododendron molle TaxID=49168 RepID=A0ACC0NPC4_RHOML|nr:hypothetical protein RHMOL_Rhmol05G0111300 [Rhododendron molle]
MAKSETSGDTSRPWQSYHTAYTNAKAGMEGVDKEKVQRIIYEMSKGSKYFENEERKDAFIKQKIENMRAQFAKLTASEISHYQKVADKRILELEATRDLTRIWLHVDMDAFYAAVETLSNPLLKGKPMAVGGMSMISTANYEARRFGVRAAMPGFIARRLCPELIFVPVDFKKYTYYSELTRKVFQKYDPNFTAASLDEAYLDITTVCLERHMSSGEIGEELRSSVYEETGLTCSAGVAPNRLLAKVCSDINKPNGQFVLPNDRTAIMTFISSLPIRKIGGIGKVTEHLLRDVIGITTCEEMLQKSGFLCALFSRSSADFFLCVGLGLGGTNTPQVRLRKSISNERTFLATDDEAFLFQKLVDLAEMLSTDMKKESLCGRTLTLKLKTASFEVRTRAVTLQNYICSNEDILKNASKLLKAELPISLRLIGLRMSQFNEDKDGNPSDPTQKTLSNFIIFGDATRRNMDEQTSFCSDLSDDHFTTESSIGLPVDNREIYQIDLRDPLESNGISSANNSNDILSYDGELEENHGSLENKSNAKFDGSSLDKLKKRTDLLDSEAVSSSSQNEQCLWVDDYKCSLCGVELPPSFVEERQEHADFHLAERLQKQESDSNPRSLAPKQRFIQKDHVTSQTRRKKKRKSSPADGLLMMARSPKRSRRDGKPATERPSSNLNSDVGDPLDRDQKHRQRLQDALPLEAPPPPDSKVETGAGRKEYDKRANEPRERSKHSSNPTEAPRRKEFDKRPSEQSEGSKRSSYPTEVPQRKEFDKRTNEQREGSKNSSNPTEVPHSRSYFQHDERGIAGQGGRTTGRGAATERGWKDSKDLHSERAVEKPSTRDTEQRDEKSRAPKGGEERVWRHDGFFEIEGDQPRTTRKRPSFREKKDAVVTEHAEKAPAEPVKPSNPDFPILGRDRRAERGGHNHHSEKPEKASVGDKEGNGGEAQRGSFPLRARYGGGNNYGGRERFNGRQGYPPPRGGARVEKWKHDLFEEANAGPTQKNEEDQIAKVEALLAS